MTMLIEIIIGLILIYLGYLVIIALTKEYPNSKKTIYFIIGLYIILGILIGIYGFDVIVNTIQSILTLKLW